MREFNKLCTFFHLFLSLSGSRRSFFCVSTTRVCLFLLVAVASSCTGKASSINVPKIVTFVGETALLPCNTTPTGDVPTVEWIKEGLFPDIAFLYRDGCETFEMKNQVFRYRTNLIRHELHNGNLSMLISNVQLNDSGKYQCVTRRNNKKQVITRLQLFVGAISEPRLSVVPGVGDEVTLQCEARCWFPEPLITVFDNQGNEISAEDPRRTDESPGCLTIRRKVTLQSATNRVTCRVHQPELNQTRNSEIYIPDACMKSCTGTVLICIVKMTFAVVITCLISFLVKNSFCSGGQKSCVKVKTINEQTNEPNECKPSTAMSPSDLSNDSTSSPGISNLNLPPRAESPHCNNLKPEASTISFTPSSNSSSESTDADPEPDSSTRTPAPSPVKKRGRKDSSSALSVNSNTLSIPSPHSNDRLPCVLNVMNMHRTGSVRSQRRSANSQESEPLIG